MSEHGKITFKTRDHTGTTVVLTRQVWEDKILSPAPTGHPEIAPYLDDVRLAISQPDIVFLSTRRQDTQLFYRLGAGKGRYQGLHIVVVVKYVAEEERGFVSTAYLTRKLYSRGRILWCKDNLLTR